MHCLRKLYVFSVYPFFSNVSDPLVFVSKKNIKRDTQGDFKLRTPLKKMKQVAETYNLRDPFCNSIYSLRMGILGNRSCKYSVYAAAAAQS